MTGRPPSSMGRPPTASRPGTSSRGGMKATVIPPPTASRMTTAMGRGPMPGGQGGAGPHIRVPDRPTTQQGLGGMKTSHGRTGRQVQDKSYFIGLLRSKVNELMSENNKLKREIDDMNKENASYLNYTKRAEELAVEIKDLQGQLGDYNMLMEKLNTNADVADMRVELNEMRAQNDLEQKTLESLFSQKQKLEHEMRSLETDLDEENRMVDSMLAGMDDTKRERYDSLKHQDTKLQRELEDLQRQIEELSVRQESLEAQISEWPSKQEAVRLYEQLRDAETKRDQLKSEMGMSGTPQEERERVLQQVKEHNQEIAIMEKQINEMKSKIEEYQNEMQQLDQDLEQSQSDTQHKYKELKRREESMDQFIDGFDENKRREMEKIRQFQDTTVSLLEQISRDMGRFSQLPNRDSYKAIKQDLVFKENEMKKAESTVMNLAEEHQKMRTNLDKVEQLEASIDGEIEKLQKETRDMEDGLTTFSDLDGLKKKEEERKTKLLRDKTRLQKQREHLKHKVQELQTECDRLKAQLKENETYTQLSNLEQKWQHVERNNFTVKDFIATKTMESDYVPVVTDIKSMIQGYNRALQTAGKM